MVLKHFLLLKMMKLIILIKIFSEIVLTFPLSMMEDIGCLMGSVLNVDWIYPREPADLTSNKNNGIFFKTQSLKNGNHLNRKH